MTLQHSRITAWFTWILAGFAILIWLPRLLGTELPRPVGPTAVIVDVTELPDSSADETDSLPTLRLPQVAVPQPKVAESEGPASDLAPLKIQPVEPAATPKNPANSAPNLSVPPTPEANSTVLSPMAVAGPAVKYWIVSSRCCEQSSHKCVAACRFVCHAVTDDCQMTPVSLEDLLSSLIPNAPACISVHGGFTRWQDVRMDAESTYRWLRSPCPQQPLNFIYFTWPSEGVFTFIPSNAFTSPVVQWDIAILGRRADVNGFYLADLIGCLPHETPVSLLGHSLGARSISASLQLLAGGTVHDQRRWNPVVCGRRIRVVFAAAAIDHDWFNPSERFDCALNRAECLLNLRNGCDPALWTYPLRRPFSRHSLGQAGFTSKDRRKLGPRGCQVSDWDVAPLIGNGHSWPRYVERPEIAAGIAPFVYFESAEPKP